MLGAAALGVIVCSIGAIAQNGPSVSSCTPKEGEGARWIAPCESAARAGDGKAAIILGLIYWKGDGVPKDNASAARWWKVADQAGRPEAAKLLGDEAFVRAMQPAGSCPVNFLVMDEAIGWYRKAVEVEPTPVGRQEAQARLDQFLKLRAAKAPPACGNQGGSGPG
jgi:hypothetical protein